jgi:uncharacterized protein (TIGR03067 family)
MAQGLKSLEMALQHLVSLFIVAGVIAVPDWALRHSQDPTKETELEGTWKATRLEYDTRPMPTGAFATLRFTFSKRELTIHGLTAPASDERSEFSIDSTAVPKQLNFRIEGIDIQGVYELDHDKLLVLFPRKGGPRPTSLVPKADTASLLIGLTRADR